MQPEPNPSREKKTRRRLRLSCVECTKRRQKCDRNQPCSLCVTRGVSHLCRWENVPVARPTPARPPQNAYTDSSNANQEIEHLRRRIATLEDELAQAHGQQAMHLSPESGSHGSTGSSSSASPSQTDLGAGGRSLYGNPQARGSGYLSRQLSESPMADPSTFKIGPHSPASLMRTPARQIPDEYYQVASANVMTSLGHHGEYVGRGTILCCLHAIANSGPTRFLYAQSTDALSLYQEKTPSFSSFPAITSVEGLLPFIPPPAVVEILTVAYFAEVNWRYGVSEDWFRRTVAQMWDNLDQMRGLLQATGNHIGLAQINASWMTLLFAIMASAPRDAHERVRGPSTSSSDDYFSLALMARRIMEDAYMTEATASPISTAADGTVVGVLAVPLLCCYLAQRGKVSQAWKLVAKATGDALSIGMHKDPEWGVWQAMSHDERVLRRRSWWALHTADKIYTLILGRSQIIGRDLYSVQIPRRDGSDRSLDGQAIIVSLMLLIEEANDRCMKDPYPTCAVTRALDDKFQQWEERLPPEYQINTDPRFLQHFHPSDQAILYRQRFFIHSWYLVGRQKLHLASALGISRSVQPQEDIQQCLMRSITASLRLVRHHTAAYYNSSRSRGGRGAHLQDLGQSWFFDGCYALFEGSVALLTTMALFPWREKLDETRSAIDSAIDVFRAVTIQERGKYGETAAKALQVISGIRELPWGQDSVSAF